MSEARVRIFDRGYQELAIAYYSFQRPTESRLNFSEFKFPAEEDFIKMQDLHESYFRFSQTRGQKLKNTYYFFPFNAPKNPPFTVADSKFVQ